MRKVILTLAVMLAIVGLSLPPGTARFAESITPTASCGDCVQITGTCGKAALAFYNACRVGGGSQADCEHDTMTWMNNCLSANGCPIIE